MKPGEGRLGRTLAVVLAAAMLAAAAAAQDVRFFRIGTGGTAGTYFPIAGVIANAISNPPGSRACEDGGSCGVTGLVATAVASNGSAANINAINAGAMESGFAQSDVAWWAFTGTGIYDGKPRVETLRVIANLYPESVHLVARKASGIRSPADLKGKRVSLDEPGSGTLADARLILGAWGISEKDIRAEYLKPNQAADRIKDGALDAFFFVGGYPTGAISELAASGAGIDLISLAGPEAEKLRAKFRFFAEDTIPEGTYKGAGAVKTLSVGAQWVTSTRQPDDLVYDITRALWNANTRKLLDAGHAKGRLIQERTALDGVGIPLHPGAARYYREKGMVK
jgi:TRAP transporter TAXI family solute receptor